MKIKVTQVIELEGGDFIQPGIVIGFLETLKKQVTEMPGVKTVTMRAEDVVEGVKEARVAVPDGRDHDEIVVRVGGRECPVCGNDEGVMTIGLSNPHIIPNGLDEAFAWCTCGYKWILNPEES